MSSETVPKNATVAIALASLVVLSGCSGILSTNESPAGSPTPSAPRSYDAAVEGHTETLKDIGRFKVRLNRSETFPDRAVNSQPFTREFVADSDRYLVGDELVGHNGVYRSGPWYQSGATSWRRVELDNGSTVYRREPSESQVTPRNRTLGEVRVMEVFSRRFPLERNGTAIFQGQRVTRYTADELGPNDRCLTPPSHDVENVTSVDVVALVDDRGIIRQFECRLIGETNRGERIHQRLVWKVTLVGVVDIRAPDGVPTESNDG